MPPIVRAVRRPVTWWVVAGFIVSLLVTTAATSHGPGTLGFRQVGHWVYNSDLGAAFHVDGGSDNVNARVNGVSAPAGSPVLQGEQDGYVLGRGQVTVFGKSNLAVLGNVPTGIAEQPVGIETPGGPYLVYRQHGQIVRLGDALQTVTVGSPVLSQVATPDGTLWVRTADHFCSLAPGASELSCAVSAPAGSTGSLTVLAGKPTFVDTSDQTLIPIGATSLGAAVSLNVPGGVPADAVVAQSDAAGRVAILTGNRLLLLDGAGKKPPITVSLQSSAFDEVATSGSAVAVLDTDDRMLETFRADGTPLGTRRLAGGQTAPSMTTGEDGRIYVDDAGGSVVEVVDGDGSINPVQIGQTSVPTASPPPTPAPPLRLNPTPPRPKPGPARPLPGHQQQRSKAGSAGGRRHHGASSRTVPVRSPAGPPISVPEPPPVPAPPPPPAPAPPHKPAHKPAHKRTHKPTRKRHKSKLKPPRKPTPPPAPKPPPASVPGPPGSLTTKTAGLQITVHWTAAKANGSPITGYQVTWQLAPGAIAVGIPTSGEVDVPGNQLHATVTVPSDIFSYVITVTAQNKIGTGPGVASKPVKPTGGTGVSPPGGVPTLPSALPSARPSTPPDVRPSVPPSVATAPH